MSTSETSTKTIPRDPEDGSPERARRRRSYLYLCMHCDRPLGDSARVALDGFDEIRLGRGRGDALTHSTDRDRRVLSLQIPDGRMSGRHGRILRDGQRWVLEDQGSKNASFINGSRQDRAVLDDGDLLEFGHTFFLFQTALVPAVEEEIVVRDSELAPRAPGLATLNPALAEHYESLTLVAGSQAPILLLGESGTGKEVMARAIHQVAGRTGTLVAVNCGAIPGELVEAELFGHRKGAYSGAAESRPGFVRTADQGTLFLDEIGDLPASAQVAFLRVLEEREVTPVGESRPVKVDFRLVAATNHDLSGLVETGRFRADLHARISGFTVMLYPLRQRREDLGLLLTTLLHRLAGERAEKVRFSFEAARAIFLHDWPYNIRELANTLIVALAQAPEGHIQLEHLPTGVREQRKRSAPRPDDEIRERLIQLLVKHQGNVSAVARDMDKTRAQLHRYARRFGIDFESFRE